jgi:hypothetical protein
VPVKVVKVLREELETYIEDMTQRGFTCREIDVGEYNCVKKINEVQNYIVVLLTPPIRS